MAGLYIHVPFCARRCVYCDFYSNTDMGYKESYLEAICKEMEIRKRYLGEESVDTIYFGGGTPSQLSANDFERIFDSIFRIYSVSPHAEITLEANPDDMTVGYVDALTSLPFNRISMGVQSFDEGDLRFLQRRHSAQQAIQAVSLCQTKGLDNLSIDLIYGLPGQTTEKWQKNLDEFFRLNVPHLSAYHLIYEEDTLLYQLKEKGDIIPVHEDLSLSLFEQLVDTMESRGYQHYEISNFARPGWLSRHNSSYWKGAKYLGIGPSAHSYNIVSRQWNVSSIFKYTQGITDKNPFTETEELNNHKRYNDYIITGLRTMWGIDLSVILTHFGEDMQKYCLLQARPFINNGLLTRTADILLLTRQGMFVSDSIMSDLLWV